MLNSTQKRLIKVPVIFWPPELSTASCQALSASDRPHT